jgi:hypothetical protein
MPGASLVFELGGWQPPKSGLQSKRASTGERKAGEIIAIFQRDAVVLTDAY